MFTDDGIVRNLGYVMRHKSEVLAHFKDFKAHVETQYGAQIKRLRTDQGSESPMMRLRSSCAHAV